MLLAAAAMWSSDRHTDAILHLARAAALASTVGPERAKVLSDAALSLTSFIDAGDDPRSIPISLHFDAESLHSTMMEIARKQPPRPPPRVRKGTLPEEYRAAPDTVRVDVAELRIPAPRVDFSSTVQQGTKPTDAEEHAAETRRYDAVETKRDPGKKT